MAAVVSATPATQVVNEYVVVSMTGGSDAKNRLKRDGTVVWAGCAATDDEATIQVGSVAGTETIDWEQYIAGTWTSVDTFNVVVTSGGTGVVATFPGSGPATPAAFNAMATNIAIDMILWTPGDYAPTGGWHAFIRGARGAGHPLVVTMEGAVAVHGSGVSGEMGAFGFGAEPGGAGYPSTVTDYITIDPSIGGGSLSCEDYYLGSIGMAFFGWSDHIAINHVDIPAVNGVDNGGGIYNQSHGVYVSKAKNCATCGALAATNITANAWNMTGTSRHVNGVQTFGEPQGAGRTFHGWTVTALHHWALIYGTSGSGVDIDGWNGTSCDATIDSPSGQTISGSVKNSNGHGSCGPLALGSGLWTNTNLTNGGGNTP